MDLCQKKQITYLFHIIFRPVILPWVNRYSATFKDESPNPTDIFPRKNQGIHVIEKLTLRPVITLEQGGLKFDSTEFHTLPFVLGEPQWRKELMRNSYAGA